MPALTPPPDPLAPSGRPLTGVRPALAGLLLTLVAAVVLGHATALFLYVAPDFPLARAHAEEVDDYMRPHFPQSWSLFAPDPRQTTTHLSARVRSAGGAFGEWHDLTAADNAAYRHQLLPSKEDQLILRKALSTYLELAAAADDDVARASIEGRYLRNVALVRLADLGAVPDVGHGAFEDVAGVEGIEMRVETRRIPPPGDRHASYPSAYRHLGFWEVTP